MCVCVRGVGGWRWGLGGGRLRRTPPVELAYDRQRGVERLIRTGSDQSQRSPTGAVRRSNLLRSKCVQDADLSEIEEEKLDQTNFFLWGEKKKKKLQTRFLMIFFVRTAALSRTEPFNFTDFRCFLSPPPPELTRFVARIKMQPREISPACAPALSIL